MISRLDKHIAAAGLLLFVWILLLPLLTNGIGPQFSLVQKATNVCAAASQTSCSVTVSALGSGQIAVMTFFYASSTPRVVTVTGWGSNYAACAGSAITSGSASNAQLYNLSTTGGGTTITGSIPVATAFISLEVRVFALTSGQAVLDTCNSVTFGGTSVSNPPGVALPGITGVNDVIVQGADPIGTVTGISAPYTDFEADSDGDGFASLLNSVSTTAPTWTMATTGKILGSAIAIKAVGGGQPIGPN